jgi:hypothetical protein
VISWLITSAGLRISFKVARLSYFDGAKFSLAITYSLDFLKLLFETFYLTSNFTPINLPLLTTCFTSNPTNTYCSLTSTPMDDKIDKWTGIEPNESSPAASPP